MQNVSGDTQYTVYSVCYSYKCLIQHAVMRPCLWRYANCISEALLLKGLAVAFVGSSAWQLVDTQANKDL